MGLAQPGSNGPRKRAPPKNLPKREGDVWKTVTVVTEHPTVPSLTCNNCGKGFCGGATRVKEHILHTCTCETTAFLDLKQKLVEGDAASEAKKVQKVAEQEVDDAASGEKKVTVKKEGGGTPGTGGKQVTMMSALTTQTADDVDAATSTRTARPRLRTTLRVSDKRIGRTGALQLLTHDHDRKRASAIMLRPPW